ncbi:MAG: MGMT family protein [Comamonadaceae bacterium]|nr:MGMT family protein [Comamonadaceae bacterium]
MATYGQIARLLGAPRSARVVGWALQGIRTGARALAASCSEAAG